MIYWIDNNIDIVYDNKWFVVLNEGDLLPQGLKMIFFQWFI